MGSLGGGMSLGLETGVMVSVDGAGSTRSAGVIGAASAGGATVSEAAGVASTGAGATGAGSVTGAAGAGANGAGAALASGMPKGSVFGFSGMCAAFLASGGRNSSTNAKKRS